MKGALSQGNGDYAEYFWSDSDIDLGLCYSSESRGVELRHGINKGLHTRDLRMFK
jgi:hypothetical protein